jgi:hypothetical protein
LGAIATFAAACAVNVGDGRSLGAITTFAAACAVNVAHTPLGGRGRDVRRAAVNRRATRRSAGALTTFAAPIAGGRPALWCHMDR